MNNEKDNKILEEYLRKLQKLEKDLNDDPDDDEMLIELNTIIDGLTKTSQNSIVEETLKPKLKFINKSDNPDPTFAKEGDSGFDLRANIEFDMQVPIGKVRIVPTGLYFEVKKGLEIQIRSRSGLAANKGIMVLNSPGTIDSDYRGEVKIILANFGEFPLTVTHGDRIAQGVVCPVYGEGNLDMIKVEKLSETQRNTSGFGDSGVK